MCAERCIETRAHRRPPLDEDGLIAQAQAGDADSFAVLVERYQDLAFRTAYLILRDTAEAEDAAQDAFINAFRALGRFRLGSPFRPWMLHIVANQARNRRKAMARRGAASERAANQALELVDGPPDATVEAVERRRVLLAAVEGMRDEDRLVIGCRYFLDLSEEETAMALGCPRGTVKSRLARALDRLRASLANSEEMRQILGTTNG